MRIGEQTYNVRLGLSIFLAISVGSAVAIMFFSADRTTWSNLRQIRPHYALLAFVLVVTQWLLNSLRFQILVNSFEERVSFGTSFRAFMANVFMSSVTPSQTGGGPLQIYILNKAGLPVARAFAGCLMGAVLSVTCLILSNVVVLAFRRDFRPNVGHHMAEVLTVAVVVFLILALLFVLSLVRMQWIKRLLAGILVLWSGLTKVKTEYATTRKLLKGLDQYGECMQAFGGAKRYRVLLAGLLTMSGLCVNALVAPVLLAGLNVHQEPATVFLTQFVIFFITYFSPTPGASGIAEFSSYWLMASVGGRHSMLSVYTVLWRFFTCFLGVGVGAAVVLRQIGQRGRGEPVSGPGRPDARPRQALPATPVPPAPGTISGV